MKSAHLSWAGTLTLVLCLGLGELSAQTASPADETLLAAPAAAEEGQQPQRLYGLGLAGTPATQVAPKAPASPVTFGGFAQMVVFFLLMTAALVWGLRWLKKGALPAVFAKSEGGRGLKIAETRALGNRQYLMVVEYDSQKILLGVCPGKIEHLCFLETPFDEPENQEVATEEIGRA